jgi:hypothetical protein
VNTDVGDASAVFPHLYIHPYNKYKYVKFEFFTAVTMKNAVFWDVALYAATCSRWFLARGFLIP